MARKRKLRSSESAVTENPDPQPEQEEQSQPDPIQEDEAHQDPQVVAADDNSKNEEQREEEEEDEEEEEEEEESEEAKEVKEEQEQGHGEKQQMEALDLQNDDVSPGKAEPEANGAKEEIECVDDEPLENLLEPFGKDQLVALLRKAVGKHPDLMDSVRGLADADPAHRKIFVHGLGWDTTAETLKTEFAKYGEIEDCKVVMDRMSGKSKGYAFILYKRRIGARKALEQPQKKIGNRITSCQLATIGPVPAPPPAAAGAGGGAPSALEYTQRKIFVNNVSAEIDPEKLLQFFRQYGEIEEGPLGLDKYTGKPKGFALFVYKNIESAKKALKEPHKNFEGHVLHCQKAVDGPKPGKQSYGTPGGSAHHYQQTHLHQPHYQQHVAKKGRHSSGMFGPGHLMAPSASSGNFNQGMATQVMNPALGQALTALIATQGTGLGFNNLLGALGGAQMGQGGPPAGYRNQAAGGYGNQPVIQGGYMNPQMNPQMGQGGAGR